MKAAIMQPYFLPYLGYFQLISAVDIFIVYDNIQYTKRGWINRNRLLRGGEPATFSLPLKKASDYLDVRQRELSAGFDADKLLNQIGGAYRGAPHFAATMAELEGLLRFPDPNLFSFIHHSIVRLCELLGIGTTLRISSQLAVDHALRKQDKVLSLCQAVGATTYVNPIGGLELYSPEAFRDDHVQLRFLRSRPREYRQFGADFVPHLSIIDALMFNPLAAVREFAARDYELL